MDVIEDYNAKLKEYAHAFADGAPGKVEKAYFQMEALEHALLDHEQERPTLHNAFLANSKAQQEWTAERQGLQESLTKSRTKYEYAKEVMREGQSHPEAIKHARAMIEEKHPELHAEYQKVAEQDRGRVSERPGAVQTYINTVDTYKAAYVSMTKHQFQHSEAMVESYTKALDEHKKTKPDFVQNLFSLGQAGKEWRAEQNRLTFSLENSKRDSKEAKAVIDAGAEHPKAREFARETVESQHPEVLRNYQREIKFQKQAAQEERARDLQERMAQIQAPRREANSAEVGR
jgi:predicted 3-demethylubiquinone-9 3-methyltransferase (glyoxalase superfamily)